ALSGELAAFRAGWGRGRSAARTGKPRKVYGITGAGRRLFDELLAADAPTATDDDRTFSLRLAFAGHLAPPARLGLLERRRALLIDRLARARRMASNAGAPPSGLDRYRQSLAEHGAETTERDISWLDRLIAIERATPAAAGPPPTDQPPARGSKEHV
ncbi:MAG: hypothetical protein ACRD0M_07920, partial [Acidimicrobiales bacterium]